MEMTRREVLAYLKQLSARGYVKTEENKSEWICKERIRRGYTCAVKLV